MGVVDTDADDDDADDDDGNNKDDDHNHSLLVMTMTTTPTFFSFEPMTYDHHSQTHPQNKHTTMLVQQDCIGDCRKHNSSIRNSP